MTEDNETLLLEEMKKIINLYNKWNLYPYELYTLMINISVNLDSYYDFEMHKKLLKEM